MGNLGRWFGVIALLLILAIAYVDRVNVSIVVLDPAFLDTFHLAGERARQGLLMTVFLLGYGVAALALTPACEALLGYRAGLAVSVTSWALLTAAAPLAGSLAVLLGARALLGSSEGPLFSLKVMYVADHFPPAERGRANAVSSMGVSLGLAAGYPLVSAMMRHFGWLGSFEAVAGLNLLVGLPLVLLFVRRPRGRAAAVGRPGRTLAETVRGALATRDLGAIVVIEIFTLAYLWGSSFWLPAFLRDDRHFALDAVGWVSALPFLVSLGTNYVGGAVVDRLGRSRLPLVFAAGGSCCAACVLALIFARGDAATVALLLGASGFWGLQSAAIPTLIQANAPAGCVGSAYGIINGIGNLVAALMPLAMGSTMNGSVVGGFALLVVAQGGVAAFGLLLFANRSTALHHARV